MNQYSILFVDDEEFVFEVMMKKLNWDEIGFAIAGYARNGVEALEMVEEIRPDVVMTDIKMPYMDGLTLCARLREQYPNTKTIIFSGFDEFEYAKEAIRLETSEYILKPIDAKELREVLERVKKALDRERNERRNVDVLRQYYEKSLPSIYDNFCLMLLEGRMKEEQIRSNLIDYQLPFIPPLYTVGVIHISHCAASCQELGMEQYMLHLSVQKMTEEYLSGEWQIKTILYLDEIVVLAHISRESAINHFTDSMDQLCKEMKKLLKVVVTAGIGHVVEKMVDIRNSYLEAKNAVSHRTLYGYEKAINIQEVDLKKKNTSHRWKGKSSADIIKYMKLGDRDKLREKVEQYFQTISSDEMSVQNYKLHIMKLAVKMIEFIEQYELDLAEIFGDMDSFPENILKNQSKDDAQMMFMEKCMMILDRVAEKRQDTRLSFVSSAEEYIKEHYQEQELGVEVICKVLNVSSSYFSTAFKKATGKTFIQYLTDYRMDQALRLLQTSDCKSYEIAEKVGYSDPNYFSYAFKKKMGVSPLKYRRQKK